MTPSNVERFNDAVREKNLIGLMQLLQQTTQLLMNRDDAVDTSRAELTRNLNLQLEGQKDFDKVREAVVALLPELVTGFSVTETVEVGPDGQIRVVEVNR